MQKKMIAVFLVFALLCAVLYSTGNVQAGGTVKLSQKKMTLRVGTQKKLRLKGTKKKVKWSSNKKKVATVSKKGVVKARKKGKAVITARVGKKKYKCKVTVINKKASAASSQPALTQPTVPATQGPISTQAPDTQNTAVPSTGVSSQPAPDGSQTPTATPDGSTTDTHTSVVYMTTDISPEGLMAVYQALNWTPVGKVAVKVSTGEPPASNYLKPDLIKDLVQSVQGTIVECNTAYGGSRAETAMHYQVAKDHGFTDIADVKILDEDGSMTIPVTGGTRLTENYVGKAFADYESYLVLSHFKGHAMAGYGGAIKNISIGLGSQEGKSVIHTAGASHTSPWGGNQDAFLESMGEAGKAVSDYLGNGNRITYVNVMNRLSIDCDCDGNPAEPDMHDIGILASNDPVALDQACIDLVYAQRDGDGASLVSRIESRNGLHTLEHAEEIGLGSRKYTIVNDL